MFDESKHGIKLQNPIHLEKVVVEVTTVYGSLQIIVRHHTLHLTHTHHKDIIQHDTMIGLNYKCNHI